MNKLTEPMQRLIANFSAGAVATINEDGTPAVSPKATFVVVSEECLAFGDIRSPNTVANVRLRPQVEINFIDVLTRRAVRVRGHGEVIEKESDAGKALLPVFEAKWAPYTEMMQRFVRVSITRAEIISSPAYDIGLTSEELLHTNWHQLSSSVGLGEQPVPQETDINTGLPIGVPVARVAPAKAPQRTTHEGRFCRLEPLEPSQHGEALYAASSVADATARFRYLPDPAPSSKSEFYAWAERAAVSTDPLFFAVVDTRSGRVEGRQTLMRINATHQSIEIGNIYWGPAISQSAVTTEANYLFARHVFEDLGYRRYEWKCDALNAPSRRAALRFGFRYEGCFRRAVIVRGRTRDTTWYSVIEEEWPALKAAYEQWLAPGNFDSEGRQRVRLSELTSELRSRSMS